MVLNQLIRVVLYGGPLWWSSMHDPGTHLSTDDVWQEASHTRRGTREHEHWPFIDGTIIVVKNNRHILRIYY